MAVKLSLPQASNNGNGSETSELELRRLYESAPVGLALLDRELKYVHVNARLAEINGRISQDHVGFTVAELIPRFAKQVEEACRRVLETAQPVRDVELYGAAPADPTTGRSWRTSYYPVEAGNGDLLGISIVVEDITDIRQTTAALSEHLRFRRLLFEMSARFISLESEQIDDAIQDVLQQVIEHLVVERSSVAQLSRDGMQLVITHSCARDGISPTAALPIHEMFPWYANQLREGNDVVLRRIPDDVPATALKDLEYARKSGMRSNVGLPLRVGGRVIGGLGVDLFNTYRDWSDETLNSLRLVADLFANAIARKRSAEEMAAAHSSIRQLTDQLQRENVYLREEIHLQHNFDEIVGNSSALKDVLLQVEQVAGTDSTVLLMGETGTGKELVARAIHERSRRRERAMVKVNCAALPSSLVESELFGREKGAYTGALSKQIGRFETADGSTILLDEIGELAPEVQSKLLRVLQEGQFERLGSSRQMKTNVRVIAATNRDLEKSVAEGRFRADLYYRLNVFPIVLPPLRDRRDDIPSLMWTFVKEFSRTMGKAIERVPRSTIESLQQYTWPGNVRELKNVIERAMILSSGSTLQIELPQLRRAVRPPGVTLDDLQRRYIQEVLEQTHWRIRGAGGAADILDVKATTLEARMEKLGITRKQ